MEVAKDLPAKIESDKIIDLAPDQRAIYTQVLREVRAQVMGEIEKADKSWMPAQRAWYNAREWA